MCARASRRRLSRRTLLPLTGICSLAVFRSRRLALRRALTSAGSAACSVSSLSICSVYSLAATSFRMARSVGLPRPGPHLVLGHDRAATIERGGSMAVKPSTLNTQTDFSSRAGWSSPARRSGHLGHGLLATPPEGGAAPHNRLARPSSPGDVQRQLLLDDLAAAERQVNDRQEIVACGVPSVWSHLEMLCPSEGRLPQLVGPGLQRRPQHSGIRADRLVAPGPAQSERASARASTSSRSWGSQSWP